jgi:hypothetical protein
MEYANPEVFAKYAVNRPGQIEAIRQPLYDYQAYAAAGQTSLTFFAVPNGQSGKTLSDTNMETAGSLPNPKRFLVLGISLQFFPGTVLPGQAPAAANIDAFVNDVYEVFTSTSYLELFIGSKSYIQAPINAFPATTRLQGFGYAADATTLAATSFTRTGYAASAGNPFQMSPPVMLEPTQNFKVTLNWPSVVAITNAGRVGVHLHGVLYRNSQ